jgi:anti-sigma factor RsiW
MNETDEGLDHDIVELLPWHAAGTLSRRDAERVEQALARNPALARHYELAREELIETIRVNEKLGAPSARAVERLFNAIDAEPGARSERGAAGLAARWRAFLASLSPRTLAWSASAAVLAIVLQAGAITTILVANHGPGVYHSAAGTDDNARGPAATVLVTFAPQASVTEITTLLDAYKASIVAGPKGNMFRLRVPISGPVKDELPRLVRRLQDEKIVSFVVPSE